MSDFGIKPEISLGVKPPQTMSLTDMLGIARGAQMYQREREILPMLVEQERIKTQTAQTDQTKNYANTFFQVLGGFANDPRAESKDPKQAVDLLLEVKKKAMSMGVPENYVEAFAAPGVAIAAHRTAELPQYMSNVIQSAIGAQGQQQLLTPQPITSGGQPGLFIPGRGRVEPMRPQVIPQAAPQAAPQAGPVVAPVGESVPSGEPIVGGSQVTSQILPGGGQPAAPQGVTAADMTAPINVNAGYRLRFQPRLNPQDVRPFAIGEEDAIKQGTSYLNNMSAAQSEVQRATRNVSEVIRLADDLASKGKFTAGKPLELERQFKEFFGEDKYKELSKSLAQAQMALIKAQGGSLDTVSGQQMTRAATGDETYPPEVLVSIARRLNGEIIKTDMEAKAARAAVQVVGPNNMQDFREAWNNNSDLRIFEVMGILQNVRDPKRLQEALDKVLPKTKDELIQFQTKYQNIEKLVKTGRL